MRRILMIGLGALALGAATPALAAEAPGKPPMGDMTPPDYAKPSNWICRPGVDDGTCSTNLDAMAIDAHGDRTPAPWKGDPDAPIDCFYIYPTVSNDPTLYSDMNAGPEERRTTHAQAARLGSLCKVYAPVYHQLTATTLGWLMKTGADASAINFDPPYADVLAAWRAYLAHDNHGRGVVLVGHSQGAVLLQRLIAEEIDGKPAHKLLVAAYLAGNLDATDRSFHAVPPCASATQTGCVVAWSSYLEGMTDGHFFATAKAPEKALCVNAAAPGGGSAPLKAYLPKPAIAPPSDPPYIETIGQLSGECVTDATGTVFRIRVEPGPYSDILKMALSRGSSAPGWGLHILDMSLVQGNLVDMIAAQAKAWGTSSH